MRMNDSRRAEDTKRKKRTIELDEINCIIIELSRCSESLLVVFSQKSLQGKNNEVTRETKRLFFFKSQEEVARFCFKTLSLLLLLVWRFCLFDFLILWSLISLSTAFYRWTQFCFLFRESCVFDVLSPFFASSISWDACLVKKEAQNESWSPSFCCLECQPWFLSLPFISHHKK